MDELLHTFPVKEVDHIKHQIATLVFHLRLIIAHELVLYNGKKEKVGYIV